MAAVSQSNINFFGSHCGISISADGPSQMALEDLAMFCAIPDCTVLYPSDAVSCERAVALAANSKGMCYIRGCRAGTPVLYDANTEFAIGKAQVVRKGTHEKDAVTIVAGGVTLDHSVKAAEKLQAEGVGVTVVDIFSIKPVDKATIMECVKSTGGNLLTVEDHYPEGGIGSAVATALSDEKGIKHKRLAVNGMPFSAPPADLFRHFKSTLTQSSKQ
jgi:transketolase